MGTFGFTLAAILFGAVSTVLGSPAHQYAQSQEWPPRYYGRQQEWPTRYEVEEQQWEEMEQETNIEQIFQYDQENNKLVMMSAASEQGVCTNIAVPTIIHGSLNVQSCQVSGRPNCGFVKVTLGNLVDTHVEVCRPGLVLDTHFIALCTNFFKLSQVVLMWLHQKIFVLIPTTYILLVFQFMLME